MKNINTMREEQTTKLYNAHVARKSEDVSPYEIIGRIEGVIWGYDNDLYKAEEALVKIKDLTERI